MTAHSSILQILAIEAKEGSKPNPNTGVKPTWKVARCVLLGDGGEVVTVGSMRLPRDLAESTTVGTYRAGFSLGVPDWGTDKGEVGPVITSLTPYQLRGAAPIAAPSPAPARGPAAGSGAPSQDKAS